MAVRRLFEADEHLSLACELLDGGPQRAW
jgi:hypothetical protein